MRGDEIDFAGKEVDAVVEGVAIDKVVAVDEKIGNDEGDDDKFVVVTQFGQHYI